MELPSINELKLLLKTDGPIGKLMDKGVRQKGNYRKQVAAA